MSSPEFMIHGRYRVIYAVDERPGSRVYRCRDDESGKLMLVAELPAADDAVREELGRLAAQIAAVRHEMLLPLSDSFAEGQAYYLVCDDPGGHDLERALRTRGGPLPEADVLVQAGRLLGMAEQLHGQRPPLMLGDPTAGDIWVGEGGEWSLVPFTLARPIGQTPSPYRAPELAEPTAEPTTVSDLYGVSALLYQALTGWPPPTAEQQKAGTPLNKPRALNPAISEMTEQALLRGLQLRPQNRYQVAREMRVALDTIRMIGGRPLGIAGEVLSVAEPSEGAQPAPAPALQPALATAPTMPPPAAQPAPGAQPYPPPGAQPYPPPGAQPYPQGYAPAPAQQSGRNVGCLIALAVALTLVGVAVCIGLALFFTPLGRALGFGAAPGLMPTAQVDATPVSGEGGAAGTPEPTGEASATPAPSGSIGGALPTLEPIELGPNAISIQNAATITATREITSAAFGPVAYSPDGRLLAIGVGNVVNLRDANTLDEIGELNGHHGRVTSLAWSADSSLIATGAANEDIIQIWSGIDGSLERTLRGHTGWIRSVAFAPSGTTLASGSIDQTIKLWDAATGAELRTLQGHTGFIGGVAFSPDGATLASASRDGSVRTWDVATGAERSEFHFETPLAGDSGARSWTTGVVYSPDGETLAVGATDRTVYLLDAATGDERRQLVGHTDWIVIRGLAFTPDGSRLISSGLDASIRIWDPETGAEVAQLNRHQLDVFSIALSPDGTRLVSVSDEEGILFVWDLESGALSDSLRAGLGIITALTFSPDSATLGMAGFNGVMQLRRLGDDTSRPLIGSVAALQPLAFLPNNQFVAITDQGTIEVQSMAGARQRGLTGLNGVPLSVAASRDGALIAAADDSGTIALWGSGSGRARATLTSSLPVITLLGFSGDGRLLAAAGPGGDPQIEIWDTSTEQMVRTLIGPARQITGLAFQPGGLQVAATSLDGTLHMWDAESGLSVRVINALPAEGWFTGLAFSPDGRLMATGSFGGEVQLWDAVTGDTVASFAMPASVVALGFSPDGAMLAVSLRDGSVKVFALPGG